MTESTGTAGQQRRRPAPRRKRMGPKPVFAIGIVTFVAFLLVLGMQVAAGKDPSLGHGKQKTKVVHRKVKRIIVTKVYDAPASTPDYGYSSDGYSSGGYSSGGYSSGGSSSTYSGGSSSSSGSSSYSAPAPTYSAPAPTVSSGASGG